MHICSTKRQTWSLSDGMERGYQPLLLTSCAALAQLPNLSGPQFLHLEYGAPPSS